MQRGYDEDNIGALNYYLTQTTSLQKSRLPTNEWGFG